MKERQHSVELGRTSGLRRPLLWACAAALLCAAPSPCVAAGGVSDGGEAPAHFLLFLNDGSQVAFPLEHRPKVVQGAEAVTVVDGDTSVEYALADVHKYVIGTSSVVEGLSPAPASAPSGSLRLADGSLLLSGFAPGECAAVYDAGGRLVKSAAADAGGGLSLSIQELAPGAYVVCAGGCTLKITKR